MEVTTAPILDICILLFDNVEVLDFAGPFEVFSVTEELSGPLFNLKTCSFNGNSVVAKNGLSVNPDCAITELERTDILIIPGGDGTRGVLKNNKLLKEIARLAQTSQYNLSVCTGALVLAKLGLLKNRQATTHHLAFELLEKIEPSCQVLKGSRFIDTGDIMTSGGISAGIDMSLYVVEKLTSREIRKTTERYMEYQTAQ
ncbi:DJ-1/PfpI family protein [Algibacillus agarilyticus]|uniref:DJ-1/PfpI family protein n=1 Tax=Algibacillus agarilyticus TaxID=2234133 RepID=UPI000DCFFAD0|nr:DJ-1/PfpI family protein [Algibacillus agarilyticus]